MPVRIRVYLSSTMWSVLRSGKVVRFSQTFKASDLVRRDPVTAGQKLLFLIQHRERYMTHRIENYKKRFTETDELLGQLRVAAASLIQQEKVLEEYVELCRMTCTKMSAASATEPMVLSHFFGVYHPKSLHPREVLARMINENRAKQSVWWGCLEPRMATVHYQLKPKLEEITPAALVNWAESRDPHRACQEVIRALQWLQNSEVPESVDQIRLSGNFISPKTARAGLLAQKAAATTILQRGLQDSNTAEDVPATVAQQANSSPRYLLVTFSERQVHAATCLPEKFTNCGSGPRKDDPRRILRLFVAACSPSKYRAHARILFLDALELVGVEKTVRERIGKCINEACIGEAFERTQRKDETFDDEVARVVQELGIVRRRGDESSDDDDVYTNDGCNPFADGAIFSNLVEHCAESVRDVIRASIINNVLYADRSSFCTQLKNDFDTFIKQQATNRILEQPAVHFKLDQRVLWRSLNDSARYQLLRALLKAAGWTSLGGNTGKWKHKDADTSGAV